ncbi:alginate export family protein [Pseudomonas mediterranea]|nr:alginate export family protein [Pseudomonas mediterranea]MDU9031242.1 alginate export family protein [Pseudomonas mediterranea]
MAITLVDTPDTHVSFEGLAAYGLFNSRMNYDGTDGGSRWQEGFIKYGLKGDTRLGGAGSVYGAFGMVSSGTWGEGDAGGFTDGSERTTKIEDASLGWRSGDVFPAMGKDGVDVSFGRQIYKVGSGFLINDDGPNLGKGPADGSLNRGGAYYLGARHSFDRTAVVRLGGDQGWHGSAAWLKSDNRAQANTEMGVSTFEYTQAAGTLGGTYIHVIDVDDRWATDALKLREGMNIYSLRGQGNAGIENANFAFEYAVQDSHGDQETGWYAEAGYRFADVPWAPTVTARYSRYSEDWDSFYTGYSMGYGTWFQGEVAANYAGPFNKNTSVKHLGLKVNPLEELTLGALYYDFNTVGNRSTLNLDAHELDLYAEWVVSPHLIITPLVGFYRPDRSAADGGTQSNGNGTNVYSQLVVAVPF